MLFSVVPAVTQSPEESSKAHMRMVLQVQRHQHSTCSGLLTNLPGGRTENTSELENAMERWKALPQIPVLWLAAALVALMSQFVVGSLCCLMDLANFGAVRSFYPYNKIRTSFYLIYLFFF